MGQPEELPNGESKSQAVELITRQNEDNRSWNGTLSTPSEGGTSLLVIACNRKGGYMVPGCG
jgi:hypothetical protein